jgi:hypothetical protein
LTQKQNQPAESITVGSAKCMQLTDNEQQQQGAGIMIELLAISDMLARGQNLLGKLVCYFVWIC